MEVDRVLEHREQDYLGNKDVCLICPLCKGDTSNLALTDHITTFETCCCDKATYPHLVKVKWHRKCYDKSIREPTKNERR